MYSWCGHCSIAHGAIEFSSGIAGLVEFGNDLIKGNSSEIIGVPVKQAMFGASGSTKSEDPAAGRAVTRFAAGSVFERHCLA